MTLIEARHRDPAVERVQLRLAELGYTEVGPVDGDFGDKTSDAILSFRRRNGLPLNPIIDGDFLDALEVAEPKILPLAQVTATVEEIAPKVVAVAATVDTVRVSWWAKITTKLFAIPSTVLTATALAVNQSDEAIALIAPVRAMFAEIPVTVWLAGFALLLIVLAFQAHQTEAGAVKAQDALVSGYKTGQLSNDAPPTAEPPRAEVAT